MGAFFVCAFAFVAEPFGRVWRIEPSTGGSMSEFKLIVAGSRGFDDYKLLHDRILEFVDQLPHNLDVSIVSGMARGADMLAVQFAKRNNVVLHEFPADWKEYGKQAGYLRNEQMANASHGLLAFWDGQSKGTAHMIRTMKNQQKVVHVVYYKELVNGY